MLKVIVDTNVFISGVLYKGKPRLIVEGWREGKFTYIISKEILEEYIKVLGYPRFKLSREEILTLIDEVLLPYIRAVEPKGKLQIVKEDPADNKFLSCALTGGADYIVSGDKHLLKLREFEGIKIVSVEEFLSLLT